ncbi:MAG TPA: alpha-amylase family glycosyl hydrolase [Pyrinomonadaceae bacterium]|nr:alpha-amylase family glycosyl hydrolase [Pyrinomonadaceae bacterium]
MGVMMQAFYWDCPGAEGRDGGWWDYVAGKVPELSRAGFTSLWLPPASKAANLGGVSMGYDPYDYYDLGDIDQKGRTKTFFGNGAELRALIERAHDARMQVYADLVINHNSGADAQEPNPITGQQRWTKYTPGSGKFPRSVKNFHPSPYESFDEMTFGDMPDLCHRHPYVFSELMRLAQWMIEDVGFDGFRFDFVKGYGPWMIKSMAEMRYLNKHGQGFKPFCVGECWDNSRTIADWLTSVNTFMDNPVSAFDFPLRYRLKDLCDTFGFSLRALAAGGTLSSEQPTRCVTFVDNHDTTQKAEDAVHNERLLAYAYILTHEGYPCVFWRDYFNDGLAKAGTPNGIEALAAAHGRYAGGTTEILHADDDLYLMRRRGHGAQPGLVLALNNRGDGWRGTRVRTGWASRRFAPVAWGGRDEAEPHPQSSDAGGRAEFWAAPRGYAVYAPQA